MTGTTISPSKILRSLGGGAIGDAHKGSRSSLDRSATLEFLSPDLRRNSETLDQSIHEAIAASALQDSSICTIRSFFAKAAAIPLAYVPSLLLPSNYA